MISKIITVFTDVEASQLEVGRRASTNVLVSSDRGKLRVCSGTQLFHSRRSTVKVWGMFPITLVSILVPMPRPYACSALALLPSLATILISPRSEWQSCFPVHLTICMFVFSHIISHRDILLIFPSNLVSVYLAPTICQACNSCQMCTAISALKLLIGRWRNAPADTSTLSTVVGSVREDEHIHWLIPLCGVRSKTQ